MGNTAFEGKRLSDTKVLTGKVRFSYAHFFEPWPDGDPNAKYRVCVLADKDDTATAKAFEEAIENAKKAGLQKFGSGFKGAKVADPIHDGDAEKPDDEVYAGKLYVNCSNTRPPQVVDINLNRIEDEDEVYSGCYGRVTINFYPYSVNGHMGIAASLQNVQKLEDGERLGGGRTSAIADFGGGDDFLA